jgi:hypothetical protein
MVKPWPCLRDFPAPIGRQFLLRNKRRNNTEKIA